METLARLRRAAEVVDGANLAVAGTEANAAAAGGTVGAETGTEAPAGPGVFDNIKDNIMAQLDKIPCKYCIADTL